MQRKVVDLVDHAVDVEAERRARLLGLGPEPQQLVERVAEPRRGRGKAQRRQPGDGAGLGLAITRSILRAHQGDIEGRTGEDSNIFEMWIPTSIVTPRSAD